jgi:anti-sigma factor RsiW
MNAARAWSDEDLSAFLDGALPDADMAALRDALADDPALAERLLALQDADAAAKSAYDEALAAPIPDRFRATLDRHFDAASAPTAETNVVDLQNRRAAKTALADRWRMPIAAGVALAVGLFGGAQLNAVRTTHSIAQIEAALVVPANPLHRVLSREASATLIKLSASDLARPVLTFVDKDGRLCREFEIASKQAVSVGVACQAGANWRVEVLLPASDRTMDEAGYQQASGFDTVALDAVMSRLGASEPMDAEKERAALNQRNRAP